MVMGKRSGKAQAALFVVTADLPSTGGILCITTAL